MKIGSKLIFHLEHAVSWHRQNDQWDGQHGNDRPIVDYMQRALLQRKLRALSGIYPQQKATKKV